MKYRLTLGLALLFLLLSLLRHDCHFANKVRAQPQQIAAAPRWMGTASCAAMGCHNANGPKGTWRSEYTTWIAHDPHARAYEILFNETSKTIVKNLRIKPAHENATCMNCHVHPGYDAANHHHRFSKEDGVGCESCHGPAEHWLAEHYKPGWNRRGMRDTKTILGRATTCSACHVGAAGMDVNHDLIAAGHPRLNFEFGGYHANLPHHWTDAKDKDAVKYPGTGARPDFEIQAWRIGQLVSAQVALQLLADRADSKQKHPWPEFAEYDCFACHHQLQGENRPQQRGFGKRRPGSTPWNTWYIAAMPQLVNLPPGPQTQALLKALNELRATMEEKIVPDRAKVRSQALSAAKRLGPINSNLQKSRYNANDAAQMFRHIVAKGVKRAGNSWDEAAQTYLALGAVHHGWKDLGPAPPPQLRGELKGIAKLLRFPVKQRSPGASFTPAAIQNLFRGLAKAAAHPPGPNHADSSTD